MCEVQAGAGRGTGGGCRGGVPVEWVLGWGVLVQVQMGSRVVGSCVAPWYVLSIGHCVHPSVALK